MLQAKLDLTADITTDLAGKRAGAVTLVGYLRTDASAEHLRLYRDPAVDVYIAILVADLVDSSSAADSAGQSMVWVRHDAILVWHESLSASTFAPPAGAHDETGEGSKWPRP